MPILRVEPRPGRPGQEWDLEGRTDVALVSTRMQVAPGTDAIAIEGLRDNHAVLTRTGSGFKLRHVSVSKPTRIGARKLAIGEEVAVAFDQGIRLGDIEVRILDRAPAYQGEADAVPMDLALREWLAGAEILDQVPALERAVVPELMALRSTRSVRSEHLVTLCRAYCHGDFGAPPAVPVVPTLVMDLALLVLSQSPLPRPLDAVSGALGERVRAYHTELLVRLQRLPAVERIRHKLREVQQRERRDRVAGYLILRVHHWLESLLAAADVERLWPRLAGLSYPVTAGAVLEAATRAGLPPAAVATCRWLDPQSDPSRPPYHTPGALREALIDAARIPDVQGVRVLVRANLADGFLRQVVAQAHAHPARFAEVLNPLEEFLARAAVKVKDLSTVHQVLVQECLWSEPLEYRFQVKPVRLDPLHPEVPSRLPGDALEPHSVRVTTQLERLPEAVPQELALLGLGESGTRVLLEKATHGGGLLIYQRKEHVREVIRKRFLVLFVADSGQHSERAVYGRNRLPSSASIHARRLIFECLRDIAEHVRIPDVDLNCHVFLDPQGAVFSANRAHWALDFAELTEAAGGDRQDFMVEIESLAPGYFFRQTETARADLDHRDLVENELGLRRYDVVYLVFLGPEATVSGSLLPVDPPGGYPAGRHRVRLVVVDRRSDEVEACSAATLHAAVDAPYETMTDREFRRSVLEDLLGDTLAAPDQQEPLKFVEGAP